MGRRSFFAGEQENTENLYCDEKKKLTIKNSCSIVWLVKKNWIAEPSGECWPQPWQKLSQITVPNGKAAPEQAPLFRSFYGSGKKTAPGPPVGRPDRRRIGSAGAVSADHPCCSKAHRAAPTAPFPTAALPLRDPVGDQHPRAK